jgi:hypothetical protein
MKGGIILYLFIGIVAVILGLGPRWWHIDQHESTRWELVLQAPPGSPLPLRNIATREVCEAERTSHLTQAYAAHHPIPALSCLPVLPWYDRVNQTNTLMWARMLRTASSSK